METAFTQLIGIEVPIVQAPIGTLTNPRLAAAVSNAGGLGMLALGGAEPDHLRRVVAETQALTDRPFGVNLNLRRPQAERVAAALEAGVRVVSLFWGDPSPHVAAVHAAGAFVTSTAGSAEEARRHADAGVDVVVAQGWEAGGHVWAAWRRCRSCPRSSTRSLRCRSSPRAGSPTDEASRRCSRWARPGRGSGRNS